MNTMDIGMLNKMMEPNTAFAKMIAEVGQVDDLTAMEDLIVAIEQKSCNPRNISVMQLFSVWTNMEPVYA